ncbi:MAG: helix-turn-helix domain-containing protein [Actinobacteria bacterium]|nr:MAG: helix-turn-helix domain-containing protein [Actinomycetota bacterium]
MLIVCPERAWVEVELVGGRLGCPSCRGVLGPWGHARERVLRCSSGDRLLRPRRARCRGCAGTHVLVPEVALVRRQDEVSVIGAAIEAKVAGQGYRRIARRLGVHADTVRGWLRRFALRVELIRAHFTRCAIALDVELGAVLPAGSGVADALEAIAVAARAWVLRFGPGDPWRIASRLSGGVLLATRAPAYPWAG